MAAAREALGEGAFSVAWEAGRALTPDDALAGWWPQGGDAEGD
jgi:hypothetical protein